MARIGFSGTAHLTFFSISELHFTVTDTRNSKMTAADAREIKLAPDSKAGSQPATPFGSIKPDGVRQPKRGGGFAGLSRRRTGSKRGDSLTRLATHRRWRYRAIP
jgi:hypothetical protein